MFGDLKEQEIFDEMFRICQNPTEQLSRQLVASP
jgi:hypothetical protein